MVRCSFLDGGDFENSSRPDGELLVFELVVTFYNQSKFLLKTDSIYSGQFRPLFACGFSVFVWYDNGDSREWPYPGSR